MFFKKILFVIIAGFFIAGVSFSSDLVYEDGKIKERKEQVMARANARHILVDSEERCKELKSQIETGSDFAEIAKEYSQCPSGKQGGDLGEFGQGQMVPEFEEVVFSAEVGKVHGPVKTDFGYHLIEITNRTA